MNELTYSIKQGVDAMYKHGILVGHEPQHSRSVDIQAKSSNVQLNATIDFVIDGDIIDVVEQAFKDTIFAMRESIKEYKESK